MLRPGLEHVVGFGVGFRTWASESLGFEDLGFRGLGVQGFRL